MLNITSEQIEQHNDKIHDIVKIVYDKKFNFLFINTESQRLFKNWDELIFTDEWKLISKLVYIMGKSYTIVFNSFNFSACSS